MIDLNYQPKQKQNEEPLGIVMLGVMPFALMIIWGILHAL